MTYKLYAGFDHLYGSEVALVGEYETFAEAEQSKGIQETCFADEGLKFVIQTEAMDHPPNITYSQIQEMVAK